MPDTNSYDKEFGRRLKTIRTFRGLTQAELAKRIGKHEMHVSKWERGVFSPTARNIVAICDALDCSADFLIGLSNDMGSFNAKKSR